MNRTFTLYRDPMSTTGVVLEPGPGRTEITAVEQLPEHRIEVHGFWTNDAAIFFCQGIETAGGNQVAFHRVPESDLGRCVVVAHLTEDRPADAGTLDEAVAFVEHRPSGEQARIIARHTEVSVRQRIRDEQDRRAKAQPVLDLLAAAGVSARYDGNMSLVLRAPCGTKDALGGEATVDMVPGKDGLWTVGDDLFAQNGAFEGSRTDPRLLLVFERHGAVYDPDSMEFSFPAVPTEGLAEAVRRIARLWDDLRPLALDLWREKNAAAEAEKKRQQRERAKERRRTRARTSHAA